MGYPPEAIEALYLTVFLVLLTLLNLGALAVYYFIRHRAVQIPMAILSTLTLLGAAGYLITYWSNFVSNFVDIGVYLPQILFFVLIVGVPSIVAITGLVWATR